MTRTVDSPRRVLITGATAGIGQATAEAFAKEGFSLILNGRRADRLRELSDRLAMRHPDTTIDLFEGDVRDRHAIETFLSKDTGRIDVLINNAGLALGVEPVHSGDPDDWRVMIETNVMGVLYMTRFVSQRMLEQGSGHIVNLGSIAGHETYPGGTVYNATKHAVHAITEATKKDLHGTPIRVSAVSPGLVETEFSTVRFRGDQDRAKSVYDGLQALNAQDIAEIVIFIATRPTHVNIMDVIVYPVAQSSSTMVHRTASKDT